MTSVLLDGMGMSMAVNGAVQDIHSWVVKLTQDVIRLSQLGRLAGAMGFTLDSIEMDIDFTQEALGKVRPQVADVCHVCTIHPGGV